MDFSTIGSIGVYTNMLKMQAKWSVKQQGGDTSDYKATVEEWIEKSKNSTLDQTEEEKNKRNSILQKAYLGAKLTQEEKDYLRTKDPQTWQKLRSIEQEQKSYEKALKKCKTKEDVQRLKAMKVNASLSTIKSVENNPHIPISKKLEICLQENYRCDKLEQSTQAFVESGEYAMLPTEAEKAIAEKKLHEAEESRRNPKAEKTGPEAKEPGMAEPSGQKEKTEHTVPPGKEKEEVYAAPGERAARIGQDGQAGKPAKQAKQKSESVLEYESPEIRKVRRAKAKAAYASGQGSLDMGANITLSIQA